MIDDIEHIDYKVTSLVASEIAHRFRIVPFESSNEQLQVYSLDLGRNHLKQLEFLLGKNIHAIEVEEEVLNKLLSAYYPVNGKEQVAAQKELESESDIVSFVDNIFHEAYQMGSSDIHIEKYETYARVRFRWEGRLVEKYEIAIEKYNAIISRIKILSELDIAERRLPQDGRINLVFADAKIDIRVSTIPGKFGEKVVMRLLTRSKNLLDIRNIGFHRNEEESFRQALQQPNGIILITGPTGSGKTTTLYAALSHLNQPDINITTIEDPIEYNLEGINQVQVKDGIGLTFGKALRAYLRQDPDIIMVGEIRDKETAEISVRAALTGHLVFSTLHTNSAWDSIPRLIDIGIPAFLLAASVRLLVAQRLVRILCEDCKEEQMDSGFLNSIGMPAEGKQFGPVGCAKCHYSGYRGRRAIFEIISVDKKLRDSIKAMGSTSGDVAIPAYRTLKEQALDLFLHGETSSKDVLPYLA